MSASWRDLTSTRRTRWPSVRGALSRPRLAAVLGGAQVLVVSAPAGYGKTTVLAAGVPELAESGELGRARAWLTLDADDADPQVLVAGLALAAQGLPGGEAVGALLDGGASPRRVAARVADVLDASAAFLVLDEAQHLAGGLTVDVLRELLDCGAGHVALLSRTPLPLLELSRLEAAGQVTRLGAAELAFTPHEVGALLRAQGLTPTETEGRLAHAVTEGWPIAVRFLAQAAGQGRVQLAQLAELDPGGAALGTLFAYLAQEVLRPLDPARRDLLTRSSVFEELTPELLEDVLAEPQVAQLLEELAGSGTFLTRVGDGLYRAHPLLRAHLREALPETEVRALAGRGAAYFERTGRPRRAMAAHLSAGNTGRAGQLLVGHGPAWLAQGRVTLVSRSLSRVPRHTWTPDLHALAGDALRLSSRNSEALAEYAQSTPLRRALGTVQVALDTVQPDLAWEALDSALALARSAEQGELLREVQQLRAENLLNAGRLAEAIEAEPALRQGVRYALRSGDLNRALELAQQAAQGEWGGARAAQNHREGMLLASFLHAVLGHAALAEETARAGLHEGERLESLFVRSLALSRLGHAQQVAGRDDLALDSYREALALAQGVATRLRVEPLMGLSALAARAADDERAAQYRDEALGQTSGDGYMRGLVNLTTAVARLHAGQVDAAGLQAAENALQACGDAFGLACIALARYAAGTGEAALAAEAAARYPFLLAQRSLFSPFPQRSRRAALLASLAQQVPEAAPALRTIALTLGYVELPAPHDTPGFEVQVQVLGRVAVQRSHEPGAREWGRAKARDLLTLLTIQQDGLSREAAQEALFPDAEPSIGERNFRVTLHALGQVLEAGADSGVFLERGEWLRLRPGPDLHVDLWDARGWLGAPTGTTGRLTALLELPERLADSDLHDVQNEAGRYAAQLPEALAQEAELALLAHQPDLAVQAATRALSLDPAQEPAARVLMRAYQERGNAAAAARTYEALREALAELGLSPLPATQALHRAVSR